MAPAEKANDAEQVPNVINDDSGTSTEVLQIVEEDHEEVEEPQVMLFVRPVDTFFVDTQCKTKTKRE